MINKRKKIMDRFADRCIAIAIILYATGLILIVVKELLIFKNS